MRNLFGGAIFVLAAALTFSLAATSVAARPQGNAAAKSKDDSGGAAPVHDLSGSWLGPVSAQQGPVPSMTPLGKELFSHNKPERGGYNVAGTNDLYVTSCDPMGFPYAAVYELRGLAFGTMPDRLLVLAQMQRIWREVWMDGRALPKNVGGTDKNSPDPRYYGFSVGHWDGDNTLVIETTGLDERTWLDLRGYPHTVDVHVEERYTRVDHNHLHLVVTVDDPKLYTASFVLGTADFKWSPDQQLDEQLCIPSDISQYNKSIGNFEK